MTSYDSAVSSWSEFGQQLRALRGKQSLREFEIRQERARPRGVVISRSQLSRYELATAKPALDLAAHVDWLYGARGWVEVAVKSLHHDSWDPWKASTGKPTRLHTLGWPAQLSGIVWLKVVPCSQFVGMDHAVSLEWGPWTHRVVSTLDDCGVTLFTGKAIDVDGVSVPMNVELDRPCFVMSGAGDPPLKDGRWLDLRRGWSRVDARATTLSGSDHR